FWKVNKVRNLWTRISGENHITSPSYGIKGDASLLNNPGSRYGFASWQDKDNNFWIFGGINSAINVDKITNSYSDLWRYTPDSTCGAIADGIPDQELPKTSLSIQPNPTDGQITIEYSDPQRRNEDVELICRNYLGEILKYEHVSIIQGEFHEQFY